MNEQPATPATPATPAAAPATPTAPATPVFTPELNATHAADAAAWIKADLAAGKISPEVAAKSFDELGTPAENRTDNRTEAAKELDEAGFVPAKGDAFLFPVSAEAIPQEGKQAVRTWLGHVESDLTSGNTIIKTSVEVGQQLANMSEAQRLDYAPKQLALLQKQYGDSLDERFAQARTMIDVLEAQRPGLKALLNSGVGDSARVVAQIFALSDRYHARRRG